MKSQTIIKLSIVIYLAVPEKDIENPGQFYFILHNKNGVKPKQIMPEKGTIVIMPNNVWHGAEPQGEGLRQTLNLEYTWQNIINQMLDTLLDYTKVWYQKRLVKKP